MNPIAYLLSAEGLLRWAVELFDGWGPAQAATVLAALLAITGVAITVLATSGRSRREHAASLYAEALRGVSDYLEGPYRIRRKDGTAQHRNAITAVLSDVKSSIDHSQALLRLHRPAGVAHAYDRYMAAATREAGRQMHEAWKMPAITTDAEVNLEVAYDRTLSKSFQAYVADVMEADLRRRWYRPRAAFHYQRLVRNLPQLPADPAAVADGASVDVVPETSVSSADRGGPEGAQ